MKKYFYRIKRYTNSFGSNHYFAQVKIGWFGKWNWLYSDGGKVRMTDTEYTVTICTKREMAVDLINEFKALVQKVKEEKDWEIIKYEAVN